MQAAWPASDRRRIVITGSCACPFRAPIAHVDQRIEDKVPARIAQAPDMVSFRMRRDGRGAFRDWSEVTKNRRRKSAIRAHQAATGTPYTQARRDLAAAVGTAAKRTVDVLPPLADWARPIHCASWAKYTAEHGPLMALIISQGSRWWDLDDLAREVAGASQDLPPEDRGLWTYHSGWTITRLEYLDGIVAKLAAVGALDRLKVRSVPDGTSCTHATCRRRRGEPPQPSDGRTAAARQERNTAAAPRMQLGPARTLDQVMAAQPTLTTNGFGLSQSRDLTAQQRQQLRQGREDLRARHRHIERVRDWLVANIAPIKTTTVGSYGMKHVVEDALGTYTSNGELIASAMMAGYPMGDPDRLNVAFGMSGRGVKRARAGG